MGRIRRRRDLNFPGEVGLTAWGEERGVGLEAERANIGVVNRNCRNGGPGVLKNFKERKA